MPDSTDKKMIVDNPQCEKYHGYNTYVDRIMDDNKKEIGRTIKVSCPIHHCEWSISFETQKLSKIHTRQHAAFDECFKVVRAECHRQQERAKPINIALVGDKYKFIGPVDEEEVHQRACVKGFEKWDRACAFAANRGYRVTN